jgi:hypothetical protein
VFNSSAHSSPVFIEMERKWRAGQRRRLLRRLRHHAGLALQAVLILLFAACTPAVLAWAVGLS